VVKRMSKLSVEALQKMDKLVAEKIQEEVNNYSESYKSSKWYREPTFEDVVGKTIAGEAEKLKEALKSNDEKRLKDAFESLEAAAKEYGKSYFDEDLNCYRTGCEYECMLFTELRNIAAVPLGITEVDYHDYYEGYGY